VRTSAPEGGKQEKNKDRPGKQDVGVEPDRARDVAVEQPYQRPQAAAGRAEPEEVPVQANRGQPFNQRRRDGDQRDDHGQQQGRLPPRFRVRRQPF
jgi:hypothetical protein